MTESLHVLRGPRIPETPGHTFLCAHFRGTLSGGECLRRQTHRRKATASSRDKSPKVPLHLEYCASGECQQGAEVRSKFPEWKPTDRVQLQHDAARAAAPGNLRAIEEKLAERPPPAEEQHRSWPEFRAQKDAERAAEAEDEPRAPPPICEADGCRTALRVNNLSGLCRLHRNRVTSRKREGLVPAVARAAGTARNALEADVEEEEMEGMRKCSVDGCTQQITPANKSGKCRWCSSGIPLDSPAHGRLPPSQRTRKKASAPKQRKPRVLGRRARKAAASSQPVQVLPGLLQAAPQRTTWPRRSAASAPWRR